jgi:protein involved in polysaccharide export with SLBB domain
VKAPVTSKAQGGFNPLNTFVVDKNGIVAFDLIGVIKVGGLTNSEARKVLDQRAREF